MTRIEQDHAYGFETRQLHAGQRPDPNTGARAVRVGAMPEFVDDPSRARTDDTIRRAREYLQATRFEEIAGVEVVSLFGTMMGDRVGEAQAGVRRDWHRADTNPDPGTLKFEEHVLPAGATR